MSLTSSTLSPPRLPGVSALPNWSVNFSLLITLFRTMLDFSSSLCVAIDMVGAREICVGERASREPGRHNHYRGGCLIHPGQEQTNILSLP